MKIILKQSDIEQALRNYVSAQGISLIAKDISMDFTAGRKGGGLSVEVNIVDSLTIVNKVAPVTATKTEVPAVEPDPVESTGPVVAEPETGYSTAAPTTASLFS